MGARQLVKLSDFERFTFAYNPVLILNIVGVLRCHKSIILNDFPLFCWRFRTSKKSCPGRFGGRAGAESEIATPLQLESKKWSRGVIF